jgi:hypothetical protein
MVILKYHGWNRRKRPNVWRRALDLNLRVWSSLHLRDTHLVVWILPPALVIARHILLIGLHDILGSNLLLHLSNHIHGQHPLCLHHILVRIHLLLTKVPHLLGWILTHQALSIELTKIGRRNNPSYSAWRMWGHVTHWWQWQLGEWLLLLMLWGRLLLLHLLINYK